MDLTVLTPNCWHVLEHNSPTSNTYNIPLAFWAWVGNSFNSKFKSLLECWASKTPRCTQFTSIFFCGKFIDKFALLCSDIHLLVSCDYFPVISMQNIILFVTGILICNNDKKFPHHDSSLSLSLSPHSDVESIGVLSQHEKMSLLLFSLTLFTLCAMS